MNSQNEPNCHAFIIPPEIASSLKHLRPLHRGIILSTAFSLFYGLERTDDILPDGGIKWDAHAFELDDVLSNDEIHRLMEIALGISDWQHSIDNKTSNSSATKTA